MQVQPFTPADLQYLSALQPPDWGDITPQIQYYLNSPFCHPIKIIKDEKLVGIGATILHNQTAWLAHIIVHPDHRNQGIGKFITHGLIDSLEREKIKTFLLIATALGEPVYTSLGFETETEYLFFKGEKIGDDKPVSENVQAFQHEFTEALCELDKQVSGEDRKWRLKENLAGAYIYLQENALEGFYLPTLGEGLIIARAETAGKELMEFRLKSMENAVFPAENLAAFEVMLKNGFTQVRTAKRMYLGEKIPFEPIFLFNRIAGSIG